jgi:hypothetical protein
MNLELEAKTMQIDPFGESRNWCFCMHLLELRLLLISFNNWQTDCTKNNSLLQISLWNIEKVNEE